MDPENERCLCSPLLEDGNLSFQRSQPPPSLLRGNMSAWGWAVAYTGAVLEFGPVIVILLGRIQREESDLSQGRDHSGR